MKQTSFFEKPMNLPPELIGLDLEPDKLPEIKVSDTSKDKDYIVITYGAHEGKKLEEIVGMSFLRNHVNTYRWSRIKDGSARVQNPYDNDAPNYILLLFEREDMEEVLKRFNIGNYKKGEINKYKLDVIINRQVLL